MPDHFDLLAPFYECAIRTRTPEPLIRITNLPIKGTLLDAGGGTGRIGWNLKHYVSRVVVADLSIGMLKQALSKEGLLVVCTKTEKIAFPSNAFERIVLVDALHHVFNAEETIQELWRVLKPGGRLVIEEPNIQTSIVKVVAAIEKIFLMRSRFYKPEKIAELFQFSNARIDIEKEGYTAWIIVDKLP